MKEIFYILIIPFFILGCAQSIYFEDLGDNCYLPITNDNLNSCRNGYRRFKQAGHYEISMNYWTLKNHGYSDDGNYLPYAKNIIKEELDKKNLCRKEGFIILKTYEARGFNISYKVKCKN